jgi:PAS domain S-box-containing protein
MAGRNEAEEHYKLLFEQNPQPMWVYDAATLEFLTVNDAALARYGYSRDQFLRMRITDIRPAEDVPALLDNVSAQAQSLSQSGVWRHRRSDGGIMLVEIASHEISFAGRRGRLVLATDVTERERAFDELRRGQVAYERQYAALAALTRRGILQTTDPRTTPSCVMAYARVRCASSRSRSLWQSSRSPYALHCRNTAPLRVSTFVQASPP